MIYQVKAAPMIVNVVYVCRPHVKNNFLEYLNNDDNDMISKKQAVELMEKALRNAKTTLVSVNVDEELEKDLIQTVSV